MFKRVLIPAVTMLLCALASPAFADLTVFLGVSPTPERRLVKGAAFGTGLLVVGFEFEYAATSADEDLLAPSLTTGMANVLVQTPVPIGRFQFYATAGGGLFRERLRTAAIDHQETSFGSNIGAGTKMTLSGPLRLRLDYRLFSLRGDALHDKVHRFYAGLNLAF